jgi:ACS family tartrate transporter-like MFS transporter
VAAAISNASAFASSHLADRTRQVTALRLLPFVFILYITNYLDRTSVAYAAIGMSRDLGFSDRVFGLGAGIFFVGYVALQIPGALLVEHWSARRTISLCMIAWGSMTALTALVHTPVQLYAARAVLGFAEAGFFPGVVVYLSHWFASKDRAKACSNFMAAIPLSFVLGSPVAGWILGHNFFSISGWRWLFILEGMPAILLGVIAFFYLTDLPGQAKWLAPEQRQWLENKLREEKSESVQAIPVWQAVRSRTVVTLSVTCFMTYFGYYSFLYSLPLMLKRLSGFSDLKVGLLGAVPYFAAFVAMQLNGWHSDKTGERLWHSALPCFFGAVGLVGLILHPTSIPLSLVLISIVSMTVMYLPVLWAIPTETLTKSAAAVAIGMINAVGNIAGFVGPYLFGYLSTKTGSFTSGLLVVLATTVAGGLLVLSVPRRTPAIPR